MTNKQVEERVKKAFAGATSDNFEQILEKCHNTSCDTKIIKMPKRTNYLLKQIISIAAVLAIVITAGFAGYGMAKFETADTIVSFDVNPSIEIELNKNEKIIRANARNDDGEKILGGMDLTGSDLSVAVNAIIGSMLRNGYLDEISNSILVSVDSGDEKEGARIEKMLMEEIKLILSGQSFNASVLSQTVKTNKEIEKLAEEYGITKGKAQLIQQIIKANPKYTFKDLAPLTINELNLIISGEKNIQINTTGNASEKRYIGKSKAKKIAFSDDGVNKNKVSGYKCKFKYKDGRMVYEITFKTPSAKYEYVIDAVTGKIIKADIERKQGTSSQPQNSQPQTVVTPQMIDEATAKAKALGLAGVNEADIQNYTCVLNDTSEKPYYAISFNVGETLYTYTIDAYTGENIVVFEEVEGQQNPNDTTASEQITSDENASSQTGNDSQMASTDAVLSSQ